MDLDKTAPPKWKTLSITHVEYLEEDQLGKLFAVYSLAPLVIVVVMATFFFCRRDLHTFTFGVGVILNHILNHVLKKYFAEPRPMFRDVVFEEAGMPSNHSQFMWFVCFYLVLFIRFRLHYSGQTLWKLSAAASCLGAAGVMSYSRVYLEYHTVSQVVWGSAIGSLSATVWFLVTQYVLTPLYPTIAAWRLAELFLIRDCSTIPNIMWFEYVTSRGEAHTRKKKERKSQ